MFPDAFDTARLVLRPVAATDVGLAVFGTAFVVPAMSNAAVLLSSGPWILPTLALAPHSAAHGVPRFLRSEE